MSGITVRKKPSTDIYSKSSNTAPKRMPSEHNGIKEIKPFTSLPPEVVSDVKLVCPVCWLPQKWPQHHRESS